MAEKDELKPAGTDPGSVANLPRDVATHFITDRAVGTPATTRPVVNREKGKGDIPGLRAVGGTGVFRSGTGQTFSDETASGQRLKGIAVDIAASVATPQASNSTGGKPYRELYEKKSTALEERLAQAGLEVDLTALRRSVASLPTNVKIQALTQRVERIRENQPDQAALQHVHKHFDQNGDNFIDFSELRAAEVAFRTGKTIPGLGRALSAFELDYLRRRTR